MSEENPIIDKIRKLLRLAGQGGTKEEGEAAMAMAQRLMTKHGIESVSVDDPEAEGPRRFDIVKVRHCPGRQRQRNDTYIGMMVDRCYGVRVLFGKDWVTNPTSKVLKERHVYVIVGDKLDVELATMIIEELNRILNASSRRYFKTSGQTWSGAREHSFFEGLAAGFIAANDKGREEVLLESGEDLSKKFAIMIVNKEDAVKEFIAQKVHTVRARAGSGQARGGGFSSDAYNAGHAIGSKLDPLAKRLAKAATKPTKADSLE